MWPNYFLPRAGGREAMDWLPNSSKQPFCLLVKEIIFWIIRDSVKQLFVLENFFPFSFDLLKWLAIKQKRTFAKLIKRRPGRSPPPSQPCSFPPKHLALCPSQRRNFWVASWLGFLAHVICWRSRGHKVAARLASKQAVKTADDAVMLLLLLRMETAVIDVQFWKCYLAVCSCWHC